jgi:hypothetical protein
MYILFYAQIKTYIYLLKYAYLQNLIRTTLRKESVQCCLLSTRQFMVENLHAKSWLED